MFCNLVICKGFPGGSAVNSLPAIPETQVWSLGQEDPLEVGMATSSNILDWRIPWKRGTWQATFHRVANSQTWLKWLSMHAFSLQLNPTEAKSYYSTPQVKKLLRLRWEIPGGLQVMLQLCSYRLLSPSSHPPCLSSDFPHHSFTNSIFFCQNILGYMQCNENCCY